MNFLDFVFTVIVTVLVSIFLLTTLVISNIDNGTLCGKTHCVVVVEKTK